MAKTTWSGPVPGQPFLMAGGIDLSALGYASEEWFVAGEAPSHRAVGATGEDGRWDARADAAAPFVTRIVVRRPLDPARFDGTLVVEWLNVTGGLDAAPGWLFLHRHLMRQGSAWVAVSVQQAGIDGGGVVPGMPLKQADAERYGGLRHPGDAHAFGLFGQVLRALRAPGAGPMGGLPVERVIALGESQSAGFLVTYLNAVDPIERCIDGCLLHGRPGRAAALDGNYLRASPGGDLSRTGDRLAVGHRVREDVRVPVLSLQSETDVVGLHGGLARQPDHEHFRLWELAGAAHFDTYGLVASQVDDGRLSAPELAERMAPTAKPLGMPASTLVNSGPQQHYVAQAALAHLERQVRGGAPPPEAPRLETLDPGATRLARDELGIARGGIRTPWVEAPSAVLSGEGQTGEGFVFLFGTTRLLTEAERARLYPGGADDHARRFAEATDAALRAGFLLEADAEEIRALGRDGRQPSGWRAG